MLKKMLVAVMALAFFALATMPSAALAKGEPDPRPICRGGADDCIPHP